MIVVIRNGEVKHRLPLTIAAGEVRGRNGEVLIDGEAPGFAARKNEIVALLKARKYNQIPTEFIARPGVNLSGLVVMDAAEYDAQQRRDYLAVHPGAEERGRINRMFSRIGGDFRYSEEADGGLYYTLLADAKAALAKWRAAYPRESAEEDAAELEGQAAAIEDNYCDLDGSLSAAEIDRLNSERKTKRKALRARAAEIRAAASPCPEQEDAL